MLYKANISNTTVEIIQEKHSSLNTAQNENIEMIDDEQELWAVVDSVRTWLIISN